MFASEETFKNLIKPSMKQYLKAKIHEKRNILSATLNNFLSNQLADATVLYVTASTFLAVILAGTFFMPSLLLLPLILPAIAGVKYLFSLYKRNQLDKKIDREIEKALTVGESNLEKELGAGKDLEENLMHHALDMVYTDIRHNITRHHQDVSYTTRIENHPDLNFKDQALTARYLKENLFSHIINYNDIQTEASKIISEQLNEVAAVTVTLKGYYPTTSVKEMVRLIKAHFKELTKDLTMDVDDTAGINLLTPRNSNESWDEAAEKIKAFIEKTETYESQLSNQLQEIFIQAINKSLISFKESRPESEYKRNKTITAIFNKAQNALNGDQNNTECLNNTQGFHPSRGQGHSSEKQQATNPLQSTPSSTLAPKGQHQ